MAVSELFTVGMARMNHATTPVDLDQIESSRLDPNITAILLSGTGQVNATFGAVNMCSPVIGMTISDLKTVLDTLGINGVRIAAAATYTSMDVYLLQLDEGGTRKGASSHMKVSVTEGLLVPRTIRATQGGGPATIDADLVCTYDGTNAPVTFLASQTLPATAAADIGFVLGPVSVNGTALSGVQSVTVDFGNALIVQGGDGDAYPTFVALLTQRPMISVTTSKASYIATAGIYGVAQTATDSTIYFRKLTAGGTRVADATAEHIKISVDQGRIEPVSTTYGAGAIAQGFNIIPEYDGTAAILAISTASAIT